MSIRDEVNRHLDTEIFHLQSAFLGEETPRDVFVSSEVAEIVLGPWPDSRDGRRHAMAAGVLDSFISGDFITMAEDPFNKAATAILARVHPVEEDVWAFRCLDPNPGIRVLGCFLELDTFLALVWDYRENFSMDQEVGDDWNQHVGLAKEKWKQLFGDLTPFSGVSLNDYVSYNFEAV